MGWFGYGLHDGDETSSFQNEFVETVGFKKNVPLKKGGTLDSLDDWDVPEERLANSVVEAVYNNWNKVFKKVFRGLRYEDSSIAWTMAADFFLNHKAQLPEGVLENTLLAIEQLNEPGGHSDDFSSPGSRKKVLSKLKKKLESFTPDLKFNVHTVESIMEQTKTGSLGSIHFDPQQLDKTFEKALTWLLDVKNKNFVLYHYSIDMNEGTSSVAEYKKNINDPFGESMGMPKTIANKLNPVSAQVLEEVVKTNLIDHYGSDLAQIVKASMRLGKAEEEYQKAQEEYNSIVPANKMK